VSEACPLALGPSRPHSHMAVFTSFCQASRAPRGDRYFLDGPGDLLQVMVDLTLQAGGTSPRGCGFLWVSRPNGIREGPPVSSSGRRR